MFMLCCRNVYDIPEEKCIVCDSMFGMLVCEKYSKHNLYQRRSVISAYLLIIEVSKISIYVGENKWIKTKTFPVT